MITIKDRKDQKIKEGSKVKFIWKDLTLICEARDEEGLFVLDFEIDDTQKELFEKYLKEINDLDIEISSIIELINS